jgi:hypothetical protein
LKRKKTVKDFEPLYAIFASDNKCLSGKGINWSSQSSMRLTRKKSLRD